ncbi:MAG: hypothetical protein E7291_07080 [Lachnospiraceae bacterium]|nr:hypothetical protein [Lachnospiraceae bacterium]
MAFGTIEIVSLTRTQDYTTIKHNEDNKGFINQTTIAQQANKDTEQRIREVHSSDNAEWHNKKFDAKDKGSNEYSGNGGRNRREQDEKHEKVLVKGHQSFDMKI